MNKENIKRAYLAAAAAAGGIVAAIILYAVVVESLRKMGHTPPLAPPGAYVLKYAMYLPSAMALVVLKMAAPALNAKKPTPEETIKALTRAAVIRSGVCELPAISGLVLFLLTGARQDFYLLAVFSAGLEIRHFPRLGAWEERLRGDFGLI